MVESRRGGRMKIVGFGFTDFGEEEFEFRVLGHGGLGKIQFNIRLLLEEFEDDIVWDEVTA